jgi:hypothetical protein
MRVDELIDEELDKWVAQAEGFLIAFDGCIWVVRHSDGGFRSALYYYKPSEQWALAGPIIEREGIESGKLGNGNYYATKGRARIFHAKTQLIATMRCHVWSTFGDEVEDDENNSNNIAKRRVG